MSNSRRNFSLIFALMLAVFLSGCAGSGGFKTPQAPKVGITDLKLQNMGLSSQTFRLNLGLDNPNSFLLPLRGFSYSLKLNGVDVAQGISNDLINIPAGGSSALGLDISMNIFSLFGRLKGAGVLSGQPLKYELSGNVGVFNEALKLPFNRVGEVSLSR